VSRAVEGPLADCTTTSLTRSSHENSVGLPRGHVPPWVVRRDARLFVQTSDLVQSSLSRLRLRHPSTRARIVRTSSSILLEHSGLFAPLGGLTSAVANSPRLFDLSALYIQCNPDRLARINVKTGTFSTSVPTGTLSARNLQTEASLHIRSRSEF